MNGFRILLSFTALLAGLLFSDGVSARTSWEFLGERNVKDRAEYDTIHVGADEGWFTALKVGVDRAPVEIKRVIVHFGNGERQVVERNLLVAEHGRSPTLDLKGGRRLIDKVVFYYEARSPGWERATVRLFGRH